MVRTYIFCCLQLKNHLPLNKYIGSVISNMISIIVDF